MTLIDLDNKCSININWKRFWISSALLNNVIVFWWQENICDMFLSQEQIVANSQFHNKWISMSCISYLLNIPQRSKRFYISNICSLARSLPPSLAHLLIHSLTHSLHSFIHFASLTHLFHSLHSFTHSLTLLTSLVHSFTHPHVYLLHFLINSHRLKI